MEQPWNHGGSLWFHHISEHGNKHSLAFSKVCSEPTRHISKRQLQVCKSQALLNKQRDRNVVNALAGGLSKADAALPMGGALQ